MAVNESPTTTERARSDTDAAHQSDAEADSPEFKNARMRNAYFWAAQAQAFMEKHTTGLSDQYHVEVMAGKPIIVTSPDFPAFEALESAWVDEGFPTTDAVFGQQPAWNCSELDDEIRYFIEPSSERLQMPFVPLENIDKSEFAHSG